jgi:hypothetical protein
MNKAERKASLLPDGVPKWVRCYDNGGASCDRYVVVFTHAQSFYTPRWFPYVAMSARPFHPQGFGQHGENEHTPVDRPNYGHLGKKITFKDLPPDCQRLVLRDYKDYWRL